MIATSRPIAKADSRPTFSIGSTSSFDGSTGAPHQRSSRLNQADPKAFIDTLKGLSTHG
jgi:hypothetical protein